MLIRLNFLIATFHAISCNLLTTSNDSIDYSYVDMVFQSKGMKLSDNHAIFHSHIHSTVDILWKLISNSISIIPVQDSPALKLKTCNETKGYNFFTNQHSAELWIPYMLRNHPITSELKHNKTSSEPLFYYLEAHFQLTASTGAKTTCGLPGSEFDALQGYTHELLSALEKMNKFHKTAGSDFILCGSHPLIPFRMLGNIELQKLSHISWITVDYDVNGAFARDTIAPYFTPPVNIIWAEHSTRDILLSGSFNAKTYYVVHTRTEVLKHSKNLIKAQVMYM